MIKKAQSLSFDAIVATGLFILLLGSVIFYTYDLKTSNLNVNLNEESVKLSQTFLLSENETQLVKNNAVDESKYLEFKELSKTDEGYKNLKSQLGVFDDFCIYMIDENGNLIMLDSENSSNFGSERATLSYVDNNGVEHTFGCNENLK